MDKNIAPPELVYVTPQAAAGWLADHNTQNRPIRQQWVGALAGEITSGRWMMTGDPIRFDADGTLIDGQHRLAAIVRAQTAVPLYVIRGLPLAVRDVIDTGASRTASDVFGFAGYRNANNLGAAARVGYLRDRGYLRTAHDGRTLKVTSSALLEWVTGHPGLPETLNRTITNARTVRARSLGAWSYAVWTFEQINPDDAVEFERSIVEARTTGPGDARLALIRFFAAEAPKKAQRPTPVTETLFAMNRTWNAWRTHEPLQRLITRNGASGPEGNQIPDAV